MTSLPVFPSPATTDGHAPQWVKVIDQTKCIGCHACTTACKSENDVPLGVTRTYVKSVDAGTFPQVRRNFQVTRCNQCADAPCVAACPTAAMFTRVDGIVDFDKDACIGCKACMAACPYDAIFINPDDHSAEKCNFCAHRIDVGLEPACAVVCPVEAILVGDLGDPHAQVTAVVDRAPVAVRRPEKDTRPKLFYRGAHQTTLDPTAARRPDGDVFAWAQQPPQDAHHLRAGIPAGAGGANSSAAALLSYDVTHHVPWDWRVGFYTWTKSIGAGVYLVAALLVWTGLLEADSTLWRWVTPLVGAGFMAVTGAVLIWDLEHPARFTYLFTRPQWRSWLVRGGLIIAAYGAVLSLHLLASLLGAEALSVGASVVGVPLAAATAVYTAFLFAQAKARDLWQSPLLPPHLLVQAALAGSAALGLVAPVVAEDLVEPLGWVVFAGAVAHLIMVLGEVALPHPTTHARLAAHALVRGDLARVFWAGVALVVFALISPLLTVPAAVAALAGLWASEHSYVQAGQSVPLA